ncbi:MAG TPA: XdhC/CoxI family protein [Cyclobacteriaceae bacterium]
MKEFKVIVNEYRKIDLNLRKAALATVVKVRGSSYRSPGARMLITDDGRWIGSISGGCLEGDALRKARQVMNDQKPITVTYDTNEESNQNLGINLGCNGIIDVLIEPAHASIKLFEQFIGSTEPLALATVFSEDYRSDKLLINADQKGLYSFGDSGLNQLVKKDLAELFLTKKSEAKKYSYKDKEIEVFIEFIQPSIKLILFGGGVDARPVSQLAKSLGWEVEVTDECVAHIAPVFFPAADKLSLCQREFVDRDFNITPYTACVLISHNYEYDRDVLKKLIGSETPYIGIMGPRKRFDKMVAEFSKQGIELSEQDLSRIYSPIGLDIGAEAPDEIALSVIAEIQSKFTSRTGGFLKDRNMPIHERDTNSDQVFKQVYLGNEVILKSVKGI